MNTQADDIDRDPTTWVEPSKARLAIAPSVSDFLERLRLGVLSAPEGLRFVSVSYGRLTCLELLIEKILAVDEALEPTLPVAGTTGYDVLRQVGGVFVDPAGEEALTALVDSAGVEYGAMPALLAAPEPDTVPVGPILSAFDSVYLGIDEYAAPVSMPRMIPCALGLRTITACACRDRLRSSM